MKKSITIVEVGPRDGLQNEKTLVSTAVKIEFIQRLVAAGLGTIEATSFVSAQKVPQMADHAQLMSDPTFPRAPHLHFPVLVPNQKGLDKALSCHVKEIAVFAAASETFSQKNINRSIEQSLQEYHALIQTALQAGVRVRGYVSCALGCPYEGKISLHQVVKVATALYQAGCYQISLGDTIGVGTPKLAKTMLQQVASEIPVQQLALHFHDTYGQALANILACLEVGVTTLDSAVAGLGGCPFAKGATGNVATEEVVYMLEGLGLETGVDMTKLINAGEYICHQLNKPNRSKVAIALLVKNV